MGFEVLGGGDVGDEKDACWGLEMGLIWEQKSWLDLVYIRYLDLLKSRSGGRFLIKLAEHHGSTMPNGLSLDVLGGKATTNNFIPSN